RTWRHGRRPDARSCSRGPLCKQAGAQRKRNHHIAGHEDGCGDPLRLQCRRDSRKGRCCGTRKDCDMAKSKPTRPLSPLPVRIVRLHAKLVIAITIAIAVAAGMAPLGINLPARVLTGWNVGIAVYLVLTFSMMWRADVARIRRRAAEQDEGATFI